uniref:Uncharacterized protein n=1 Tax=Arcella intermedia TaxID=1963864 RepID=A0A6B2LG70_9EUKA
MKDSLIFHVSLGYNLINHDKENQPWWDRVTEHIVLGALPFHDKNHRERLVQIENVGAVVIMCQDFEFNPIFGKPVSPLDWLESGVEVLHMPTEDFNAPNVTEISTAVSFIQEFLEKTNGSKSVYVHCKAGRGRSVAVVVCYLISSFGKTTDEAIEFIQKQRPHINMGPEQTLSCRTYEQVLYPDRLINLSLAPSESARIMNMISETISSTFSQSQTETPSPPPDSLSPTVSILDS